MAFIKLSFYMLLLCNLVACSDVGIYFVKKKVVWVADEYFELNENQEKWINEKLDDHVMRIRTETIQNLTQIVDKAKVNYADGIANEEIDQLIDELYVLANNESTLILSDFIQFIDSCEEKQLIHAGQVWIKNSTEKKETEIKKDEENALGQVLSNYEKMYGTLTEKQIGLITDLFRRDQEQFRYQFTLKPDQTLSSQFKQVFAKNVTFRDKKNIVGEWKKNPQIINNAMGLSQSFDYLKSKQKKFPIIDKEMDLVQRKNFENMLEDTKKELLKYSI